MSSHELHPSSGTKDRTAIAERGISGNSVYFAKKGKEKKKNKKHEVVHPVGDYKNAKTHPQCLSLMEKLNFIFYFILFIY